MVIYVTIDISWCLWAIKSKKLATNEHLLFYSQQLIITIQPMTPNTHSPPLPTPHHTNYPILIWSSQQNYTSHNHCHHFFNHFCINPHTPTTTLLLWPSTTPHDNNPHWGLPPCSNKISNNILRSTRTKLTKTTPFNQFNHTSQQLYNHQGYINRYNWFFNK